MGRKRTWIFVSAIFAVCVCSFFFAVFVADIPVYLLGRDKIFNSQTAYSACFGL